MSGSCYVKVYTGENPEQKIAKYLCKCKSNFMSPIVKTYMIQHANWQPDDVIYASQINEWEDTEDNIDKPIGRIWRPFSPIQINHKNNSYYNQKIEYWPIISFDIEYDDDDPEYSTITYESYKHNHKTETDTYSVYKNIPVKKHKCRAIKGEVTTRGF